MNWIKFSDLKPWDEIALDSTLFLVTDGKDTHICYTDHNMIWFVCSPNSNLGDLESRLTHWAYLKEVPYPRSE